LQGRLSVASVPDIGSIFTLYLPVHPLQPPLALPGLPPVASTGKPEGMLPQILLIEDDPEFAAIIRELAVQHHVQLTHVGLASAGIRCLDEGHYDALILDILLPDRSGWDVLRHLRRQERTRMLPVHILSGVQRPIDWHNDLTHYLVKPVSQQALEALFADIGLELPRRRAVVLLVEDNPSERDSYARLFQVHGFQVLTAATAAEARQLYAATTLDCLAVDMDLPDHSSFSLLGELNQLRPFSPETHLVVFASLEHDPGQLDLLQRMFAQVIKKERQNPLAVSAGINAFFRTLRAGRTATDHDLPPDTHAPLAGRTVLLVDDDVRNLYAMTAMLEPYRLHVLTARHGDDAVALLREHPVDIVLMDMAMPVMDGYTATRVIREQLKLPIPVLALTAHAMAGDEEKCRAAGANDYLTKPVTSASVLAALTRWLTPAGASHD
jgi:CheY-like chemotaxis protein